MFQASWIQLSKILIFAGGKGGIIAEAGTIIVIALVQD
jgi:hypothetical protein